MESVVDNAVEILAATDTEPVLLHVFPESEFWDYLREIGYDSADPDEVTSRHNVIRRAAE